MEHHSFLRDGKLQVKFQRTYYYGFTGGSVFIDDQSRLDENHKIVLEREFDIKL